MLAFYHKAVRGPVIIWGENNVERKRAFPISLKVRHKK